MPLKMHKIAFQKKKKSLPTLQKIFRPITQNTLMILDPDEMPHYAAFRHGLHCLLLQKRSSEKEIQFHLEFTKKEKQFYLEIITFNPLIHTKAHPKFIVSNPKEESISV